MTSRIIVVFALSLGLSACSLVVSSLLSDPVADCSGHPDGTPCSAAEICISGSCTYSSCGDAYVDTARGEQCDDANVTGGDGCEPGRCRFTCTRDEQCVTNDPCRGNAGCNLGTHRCRPQVPLSGSVCEYSAGVAGTCRTGSCAAPGCGDGIVGADEECDDTSAGCGSDCQFVCDAESQCTTSDVCTGQQACDVAAHVCEVQPPLDCDDGDACTSGLCDPTTGCSAKLIDNDQDGYAPATCAPGSPYLGDDCDDTSPSRHPGAPEMLNQLDDDCDMIVDEDPGVTCLRDADGDGWGDPNDALVLQTCPTGRVAERNQSDCNDGNAAVSPSARLPSGTPYCVGGTLSGSTVTGFSCSAGPPPSWDWDCDGREKPWIDTVVESCKGLDVCGGSYWADSIPACGATGTLRSCMQSCQLLVACQCTSSDSPDVIQRCL